MLRGVASRKRSLPANKCTKAKMSANSPDKKNIVSSLIIFQLFKAFSTTLYLSSISFLSNSSEIAC